MSRYIFILFLLFCMYLKADSMDIDCNDLYGNCAQSSTGSTKSTTKTNESSASSATKQSGGSSDKTAIPKQSGSSFDEKPIKYLSTGATPNISTRKGGFIYSVVFLTALFDNGVQKQGYGILLKDGYTLASASLITEENAFLRNVTAKMQDDTSNTLMCFAMLRLRATDNKLSLLRAENYTDIYCNTRPESFYHQRINLHAFTPIRSGTLKNTILSSSDSVLFPYITENNNLKYRKTSISNIQKSSAGYGLPLFNSSGNFVGFLKPSDNPKQKNMVVSSDEVGNFICQIARRKLLPVSDLTRPCLK